MHLHAALVPPSELTRPVIEVVRGLEPPRRADRPVEQQPTSRRGLFRRREEPRPAPPPPSEPLLDVIDVERLSLPITDFGYLAAPDARRLLKAITDALAELDPVTVRVSGGAALVDEDDRSVWAELSGDPDDLTGLRRVASAVVASVQPLGLFCDRRQFKPRLALATINDQTTAEHLEAVLASLADWDGEPWLVDHVQLLQRATDRRGASAVWASVPIGVA
jgi:2'-5' RNA ligase